MKDYEGYCWIQYIHGVKNNSFAKIGVGYVTDKGINPDPFVFTSNWLCDSRARKKLIKYWRRMLDDLEKAPVYKEGYDGIYTMVSPYKGK